MIRISDHVSVFEAASQIFSGTESHWSLKLDIAAAYNQVLLRPCFLLLRFKMQIVSAGFHYVSVQRLHPSRGAFVYGLHHIWHDKAKFPSNAADECSLHLLNWEVA